MRVLGLGDNTVDVYVDRGEQYPGGNAVNVAVMAQRLGAHAAYCGCLGNDEAGAILRLALATEGIDTGHCRNCAAPNARAYIAHNKGDRRFIRSEAGCRADWSGFSNADELYIGGFDVVHSSIFSGLEVFRPQLRRVIRQWAFDFSEKWTPDILNDWLPWLDSVFLSFPSGSDDDVQALGARCASSGPATVVITRGRQSAYAWRNGVCETLAPQPVAVVDTLGAGDGFIAAFLVASLRQDSLGHALAAGMKNAAGVCGRFGAFGYGQEWRESPKAFAQ